MPSQLVSHEAATEIQFSRTVEKALVHRAAISEVFVTDMRQVGDARFQAGAQLPLSHAYYSDHLQVPRLFDPLLLLESSRQAAVCGAHEYLGIPLTTSFLVNSLSISFDAPMPLRMGGQPGELHIETSYPTVRRRGEEVRAVDVSQDLYLKEEPAGHVTMKVSAMSPKQYRALRYLQRDGEPPTTADAPHQAATVLPPSSVVRESAQNVVLTPPALKGQRIQATLAPRFHNRSLFDHTYDHIPAMVLLEGARQLALLAAADMGLPVQQAWISQCSAEFLRFAELDAAIVLSTPRWSAPSPGDFCAPVRLRQAGATVAEMTLTVGTLPKELAS
ncbi:ScbA/BarX family gamma-butyrolactone biosynthesis protein [Streptomyces sp. NPDC002668]|uniref:ScbA/BarX family gamma-butyrolactone biosynthesis protein n=1 Tax=Streptomyces sp. NPDC002668 TaxID=3154422 RepID=UPI0033309305